MDSQNNQQIIDNVKSVLHVVSIGLAVASYFVPNLAVLTIVSSSVNALYHAITTNNK